MKVLPLPSGTTGRSAGTITGLARLSINKRASVAQNSNMRKTFDIASQMNCRRRVGHPGAEQPASAGRAVKIEAYCVCRPCWL
jgi:hypothetical protein